MEQDCALAAIALQIESVEAQPWLQSASQYCRSEAKDGLPLNDTCADSFSIDVCVLYMLLRGAKTKRTMTIKEKTKMKSTKSCLIGRLAVVSDILGISLSI
jgi:hypothetical protein